MIECRYVVLESVLDGRKCYGIAAVCDCDDSTMILVSIADVCPNRQLAAAFVDRCNSLELSLWHLQDAVDDFLANL